MIESFANYGFGQTEVKDLLDNHQVLTHGQECTRKEIADSLVERFLELGGDPEKVPEEPARAVKNLLPGKGKRSNERFEKLARGRYRYIGQGSGGATAGPTAVSSHDASAAMPPPDHARGEGTYEVYAWCLPQDENTDNRWPIKIGYAGEGGFGRRWRDFAAHLPVLPRYLRSFRYETEAKARNMEGHLHYMLGDDCRRQRVQDIPGREWFLTSPDEIDELMRHLSPQD